jgi:YebC/PmpR family DNA-binding regulatory protein
MSGHSKWSQIKHKKALTDKKRAQLFSQLSRLITLAARKGADPHFNFALQQVIDRARKENIPNENIERAIRRASDKESSQLEEIIIDVVGPGGVAIKIKAVTDNKNRTIAEIKKIISNFSAKMVPLGSIDWMFSQPQVNISSDRQQELDSFFEALDDQGEVQDITDNLN